MIQKINILPKSHNSGPKQDLQKLANKAEFSAGLSHEIATPLASVKTNLKIMKYSQTPTEFIDTALMGLEQIDMLIQNYLQLSKQCNFNLWFNPNMEIVKSIKLLNFKLRRNKIKVKFDLHTEEIYGNPIEFNQVVANLISNAADAYNEITEITDKGTRQIELISRIIKNIYILKVVDYGSGISKAHAKKIFESYFTTKSLETGTGLGLSVSKKIVRDSFHGTLELSSRKSPTIFTIKLPIKEKEESDS